MALREAALYQCSSQASQNTSNRHWTCFGRNCPTHPLWYGVFPMPVRRLEESGARHLLARISLHAPLVALLHSSMHSNDYPPKLNGIPSEVTPVASGSFTVQSWRHILMRGPLKYCSLTVPLARSSESPISFLERRMAISSAAFGSPAVEKALPRSQTCGSP